MSKEKPCPTRPLIRYHDVPRPPRSQTRLTREYGVRHPFVGAGMGFIAHEQLAAAVTNAGGLGVLGASPDPADSLIVMVERLRALTCGPFGVDLICADTGFGPASTDEHIDACVQLDVPLVVFHHDLPPVRWVSTLRTAGIRVWMQASSPRTRRGCNRTRCRRDSRSGQRGRWPRPRAHPVALVVADDPTQVARHAGVGGRWHIRRDRSPRLPWVWAPTESGWAPPWSPPRKPTPTQSTSVDSSILPVEQWRTNAFGPEWPDQPYRLLATPVVRSAEAGVGGTDLREDRPIGRTRLFPHSVNMPYDMPIRSTLPPTPETSGDWESMAYPAGEGVGAVRRTAPAAEIIRRMMNQAYDILDDRTPAPRPEVNLTRNVHANFQQGVAYLVFRT